MKFDHVTARFGGRDLTFKIGQADINAFEAIAETSAYRLFRALTVDGDWTVAQIVAVLQYAALPEEKRVLLRNAARLGMANRALGLAVRPSFIDKTVESKPGTTYVSLAAAILAAPLFGGIDKEDAVFTDEVVAQ